jgi:hypothetical protein
MVMGAMAEQVAFAWALSAQASAEPVTLAERLLVGGLVG